MALIIFIGIPASAAAVADPMHRLWVPKSSAGSLSECSCCVLLLGVLALTPQSHKAISYIAEAVVFKFHTEKVFTTTTTTTMK